MTPTIAPGTCQACRITASKCGRSVRQPPEVRVATREPALAEPLPEGLTDCAQFTFLGSGWTVGLAHEACLKMREAALAWTESYPAMEYRHGPISITTDGTATWMLGPAPRGLRNCRPLRGAPGYCRLPASRDRSSVPFLRSW